ncbi:MAG: hypothetical protein ACI4AE_05020 [Candidatus Cryptobacteroides sp.]
MTKMFPVLMATVLSLIFISQGSVHAQNSQQQKTPEELAANEADRLERLLDLEGWQVFYVDSTLQHDFAALTAEVKMLQDSKVDNLSLYQSVQDKWWDKIDASYRKIFTDEQWAKYLKNGALKNQKARAKRKAKAEASQK